MSTPFYDLASLVLVPSGYKTSKVYAQKPLTTDGQLAFTRASTATRVGPDGLIEKVRTNLVLQSETLDNAYWSKTNVSITANAAANPLNGALTAELLTVTDPSGPVEKTITTSQTQSFTAGIPITASAYFKAGTISTVFRILAFDGTTLYQSGTINLAAIGSSTALYEDVGGGWYRFRFTFTPTSSTATGFVYLVNYAFGIVANAGTNVLIFGAQIETGDIATPYIPTTTAAVSVGMLANVPRLDYLGSTCPRLLLEPQRVNLITFSEQLNTGSGGTSAVTANTQVSPDGYTNADTIGAGYWTKSTSQAAGTYTLSVFAKYQSAATILLYIYNGAYYQGSFNLQTGVATSSTGSPSVSMVSYGNGWYRCIVTATTASTISEVGFGSGNFYGYGLQLEAGAYATSYIPTLGAAVTRSADAASKTGISALIGQTEGTLFWEFAFDTSVAAGHESVINIDNGSFGNTVYIIKGTTGTISAELYVAGVVQASFALSPQPAGTYKAAFGYANNNTAFFINGVQVGTTDTSCSVGAMSRIQLGNGVFGASTDKTAQALLFKTRLTNAQLAELTA